jgi:3-methylcrotonyl-CoA carboxylase alpha subunit
MHHAFKLGEAEYELELSCGSAGYRLHFDGALVPVDLAAVPGDGTVLITRGVSEPVFIATRGDSVFVHLDGAAYQLAYEHPLDRLAQQSHGAAADAVRAPMPGSVISVLVQAGQGVARGETLLVMESMKMETTITAPRDGVIGAVHFAAGQTFDRDALLLNLQVEQGA